MANLQPGDEGYEEVRAEYVRTQVEKSVAEIDKSIDEEFERRYQEYITAKDARSAELKEANAYMKEQIAIKALEEDTLYR